MNEDHALHFCVVDSVITIYKFRSLLSLVFCMAVTLSYYPYLLLHLPLCCIFLVAFCTRSKLVLDVL